MAAFFLLLYGCNKKTVKYVANDADDYDVIVVGGGFSGLTAAYYLKDKKVLVLEKEAKAGGRCQSGTWEGFYYPKGTEYKGPPEAYTTTFFNEIGAVETQVPPPTDGVAYNGQFYLKRHLLDYLGTLSAKTHYYQLEDELYQLAQSGIEAAVYDSNALLSNYAVYDNMTVEDWLNQNNYEPMIQKFVNVENRGLFGANNKNLSMLFNIPEMYFDLPDTSSINQSEVYTFQGGMYSIVDGLVNQLGDKVVCGANVQEVFVNNDLSVSVKYIKDGVTKVLHAQTVVMATPAPITAQLVTNGLTQDVRSALGAVDYSQYMVVNLFLSERLLNKTFSISCIDENFVTLYDALWTQVPITYTGKSIMGIYMAPQDASDKTYINKTDAEVMQLCYAGLETYSPGIQTKVLGYDITRYKYAFPVFSKAYNNTLQVFYNDHSVQGPLFLAGDYLVYPEFDGAFISGQYASDDVRAYLEGQ